MKFQHYLSAIKEEVRRDNHFLHLTPNEPYVSNTARSFMSSRLADRYYYGGGGDNDGIVDFGEISFLGRPSIASLIDAAAAAGKKMLNAEEINLGCLSGIHAMMCAILSTTEPGDAVMTVRSDHGGHFATKGIIDRVGRRHVFTSGYNYDTLSFDTDMIAQTFKESGAKAFYMDVSHYLNPHNLREIRAALGAEAIIIYDASHTMGLIMGQQFQSPLKEGADVICANTHKTLPGPQKGMIAFRDKGLGQRANNIINDAFFSSPHTASTIALAITILEMQEFGEKFAKQIISNSNILGEALENHGNKLRKSNTGRYSENHQVHLFTGHLGNYRTLHRHFLANSINLNFNHPDIFKQGAFIRLGTQEITRRGMKEFEMNTIASFIDRSLKGEYIKPEVEAFINEYRTAHYSFDNI
jgi:glycine/serine hydroxymethyltransferase